MKKHPVESTTIQNKRIFPSTWLAASMVLAMALLIAFSLFVWNRYAHYRLLQNRSSTTQRFSAEFIYYDEVLTMSAKMAAASGDPSWEQRYLIFDKKLSESLKEAKAFTPKAFIGAATAAVDQANNKLVDMEKQAFLLVQQGNLQAASTRLAGQAYQEQKEIYKNGIDKINTRVQEIASKALTAFQRQAVIGAATFLIVLLILFFSMLGWTRALAGQIGHVQRAEAVARALNKDLEAKVTERTAVLDHANDGLRASEFRYRQLIENQGEGIGIVDNDEFFVFVNPAAEEIFGVEPGTLTGRSLKDFLSAREFAKIQEQTNKRSLTGKNSYELQIVRPDGEMRTLLLTASPRLNEIGQFSGTFGIFRDISKRKRTEMIQTMQYNIANAMVTVGDPHDLYDLVKRELATLLDTTNFLIAFYDEAKAMLSTPFEKDEKDAIPEWPVEKSLTGLLIKKGKSLLLNKEQIRELADAGEIKLIGSRAESWLGVPLQIGDKRLGAVVVQSYDDAKAFDENSVTIMEIVASQLSMYLEHQRSEERIRFQASLLLNVSEAIIVTDKNSDMQIWNQAAENIYGWKAGEAIGKKFHDLINPEYRYQSREKVLEILKETGAWSGEIIHHHQDGRKIPVQSTITILKDAAGNPAGMVSINHDISERKKSEEAMQQANEKLTCLVQRLEELGVQSSDLSEMGGFLLSCSTSEEIQPVITHSMKKFFPATAGALFLLSPSRTDLESVASWGDFPKETNDNVFSPDACWGLTRGGAYTVDDVQSGLICKHLQHAPITAYACLPLMAKGEVLGLLHIRKKSVASPEDSRLWLAGLNSITSELSKLLSLSISNIRLREKLSIQSIRDPLTGLFNRRFMEESFQKEIRRAARKKESIGMVMVDIDHFKTFNDLHGHAAGDAILVELSTFFKLHLRGADFVCRYGGEEFAFILPESSLENTGKRAAQLAEELKALRVAYGGETLGPITLSMGIAAYPLQGTKPEDLLRAADAALYRAKQQGRDRIVLAG
jgi:diguanylate cyclase (GGDEF)-like protein/PAS domain S-box-containing protein